MLGLWIMGFCIIDRLEIAQRIAFNLTLSLIDFSGLSCMYLL